MFCRIQNAQVPLDRSRRRHTNVGLTQAANGTSNAVFAITASMLEYDACIKLALEQPQVMTSYLAYFGDLYLANPRLLPPRLPSSHPAARCRSACRWHRA